MKCESRSVRTVTTRFKDSDGNLKSHKHADLSGKSVSYEGEYSETDSECESEHNVQKKEPKKPSVMLDQAFFKRQKLLDVPNIELRPTNVNEYNESFDESNDMTAADVQAKIDSHLAINLNKNCNVEGDDKLNLPKNVISDVSNEDEKNDSKVIDSTDEKTGMAIRTNIDHNMKLNENVKVCKADNVDVKETDEAIVKKITTKTRTTKSVVKTTTKTTTKKGTIFKNSIFSFYIV